jgi:hypothetical protein
MAGNPFAEAISGRAMEGVGQVHRQVIGQMDELARHIDGFTREGDRSANAPAVPQQRRSGTRNSVAPSVAGTPFTLSRSSEQEADAPSNLARNPFGSSDSTIAYDDSDSGRLYSIPAGHSLYRNPGTGELSVVRASQVRRSLHDDRIENGQLRCSLSGKGLVLPECERRRKLKNPFAPK